ncbi:MAG TPA: hypothetical protein VML01_11155, partial [Bryobacterales bacterium]|nr:hypothetical protein [Bryobacterales bacterium]
LASAPRIMLRHFSRRAAIPACLSAAIMPPVCTRREISGRWVHRTGTKQKQKQKNLKPLSAAADTPSTEPDQTPPDPVSKRFAALWDSSPRRGSRKASLAAFEAILKKEPNAADEIEHGLAKAKRSDQFNASASGRARRSRTARPGTAQPCGHGTAVRYCAAFRRKQHTRSLR